MGVTATTLRGRIRRLALNDPKGRNELDADARSELASGLQDAYGDPDIRAIVIGTDVRNFSAGGDLARVAEYAAGQSSHRMMRSVNDLARLLHGSPKPLIAAVAGHCVGAGAGLALLCDVIVCGRSAKLGFPFLKLGLVPDFGVSFSLPRRIGAPAARRALLGGLIYDGDDALALGLVDECVDDGQLNEAALDKAALLADAPANALLQLRLMLRREAATLADALETEALNQAICFGSADLAEGIAAFREKRPANFVPAGGDRS